MTQPVPWIAELDLARFFDPRPHTQNRAILAARMAEQTLLRLLARMRTAGIQTPGGVVYAERGSPHGSIVSPVSATAFLDHGLEQWCVTTVPPHCRGYCALLRYADAALALFACADAAHRFLRGLP